MIIRFHRQFEKRYKALRGNQKEKFKQRRNILLEDPFHPLLNNHPLRGKYHGYRSINIGGDLRAIFKVQNEDMLIFVDIGPHARLYG
jgi:addiction module RelE/StbE family toxin